jgi:hypothetical protein
MSASDEIGYNQNTLLIDHSCSCVKKAFGDSAAKADGSRGKVVIAIRGIRAVEAVS